MTAIIFFENVITVINRKARYDQNVSTHLINNESQSILKLFKMHMDNYIKIILKNYPIIEESSPKLLVVINIILKSKYVICTGDRARILISALRSF